MIFVWIILIGGVALAIVLVAGGIVIYSKLLKIRPKGRNVQFH
jgi:hypothetical protein